nr:unnamed protein product [Callosobruchus chinensis]
MRPSVFIEQRFQIVLVESDQRHDAETEQQTAQMKHALQQVALVFVGGAELWDHVHQGDVDEHTGGRGEYPGASVLHVTWSEEIRRRPARCKSLFAICGKFDSSET